MDNGNSIFNVICREPDGEVVRTVSPARLTIERLHFYYDKLREFPTLFNSWVTSEEEFYNSFLGHGPDGELVAKGLIWEVDDVGLFFLTELIPGQDGLGHFTFWDRRTRGREELLREMIRFVFQFLKLHRITVEIPLYTAPWLPRFVEKVGFVKEGRKREAALYEGQWFDVNIYSILSGEI